MVGREVTFIATSRIPLSSPWPSPWPPLKLLDKGSGDIAGPVNYDQITLYKHGIQEPTPVDVHDIIKEAFARGVVFQKVPTVPTKWLSGSLIPHWDIHAVRLPSFEYC